MSKRKNQSAVNDCSAPQRKKKFHTKDLRTVQPLTPSQKKLFNHFNQEKEDIMSYFLYGSAGTGKTFSAMYLALAEVLDPESDYDNLIVVRSTVPARDVGFLPGDLEEKIQVYEEPYMSICDELFEWSKSYENLKKNGTIRFMPTSFLRGTTFDHSVILVDETQNMTFQELDTIMTRVGKHSKIYFCGDYKQSDLIYKKFDTSGFADFKKVIDSMDKYFHSIEFSVDDIVRSGIVKEYLLKKEKLLD